MMSAHADAVAGVRTVSIGQLKGGSRGGLICTFLGSAWMFWAVVFSGHPTSARFAIVTVPAIALMAWAILRVRASRRLVSSAADQQHWKAFRKFFWIDSGIEWVLAGVAAFVLSHLGRYDLIPQALGVIIGLHFLPLAKILRTPRYYGTASVMVVGALASLFIPRGDIRNIVGCAVIGLTLWITGLFILFRTSPAYVPNALATPTAV
jgi:hypothetical protein